MLDLRQLVDRLSSPTRCVGLSGVTSSGCCASSCLSSAISRSYSRSLISGPGLDVILAVVVADFLAQLLDPPLGAGVMRRHMAGRAFWRTICPVIGANAAVSDPHGLHTDICAMRRPADLSTANGTITVPAAGWQWLQMPRGSARK